MPTRPVRFPDSAAISTPAVSSLGPTRALIDLDAIAFNVEQLARCARGSEVMAVVKANAYGHGSVMVARTALRHGATWLGVYAVQEGLVLREAGIQAPILVFGPFTEEQAPAIVAGSLTPTITNLDAATAIQRASQGRPIKVHIKIDTGLARAGVAPGDAPALLRAMTHLPDVKPEGLYTHFASADERRKDLALEQLRLFRQTVEDLVAAGFTFKVKHGANSAAILDLPASHLDLVRAGVGLYGYYPSTEVSQSVPLRPALSLVSTITRVHAIPAGAGVGYGHEFIAPRDTIIALAPIGYGDGLSRRLGNGRGKVLIRGRSCPIVGRVSMDQITIDVTDVPSAAVGDDVVLIGTSGELEQTADDVAAQEGTISYEVLTALLPRVPRVYLEQGEPVAAMSLPSGPRIVALGRVTSE